MFCESPGLDVADEDVLEASEAVYAEGEEHGVGGGYGHELGEEYGACEVL